MTPWRFRHARRELDRGGVLAYPTEAVFGLGCDPANPVAVARILALKNRSWEKGLILIAADLDQVRPWIAPLDSALEQRVLSTWPGPVTWLLPTNRDTPAWLTGAHDQLAVRVPDHPLARALCRWRGPLVSTSANPEGRIPARTSLQVRRYFPHRVSIFPGRVGQRPRPSEIRDSRDGRIVRAG